MKRNKLKIVVEVTIPADARRMDDEASGLILAQARSDDHNTNQTKAQDRVSYSSRKLLDQKIKDPVSPPEVFVVPQLTFMF